MTRARRLGRSFFDRDARDVAPELLHKVLVHRDPEVGRLAGRIVETEAYCGAEDPGSHAYRGRTLRNATMFGKPGCIYVYFTYGMHWCVNVVCGPGAEPHAVLLRAVIPLTGVEAMRSRRMRARTDRDLCRGPARLAQAFGFTRKHDGLDLLSGPVRILDDGTPPSDSPGVAPRVGLASGKGEDLLWRWFVAGDPHVSRNGAPMSRGVRTPGRESK